MNWNDRTTARGLAWVGIGLGLAECLAPRRVAEATGLEGYEGTLRLFGLREIASGIAVLAADAPERRLGLRVAGDLLDGAVLAAGLAPGNRRRDRTALAALAVAPVVVLDLVVWLRAGTSSGRRPGRKLPMGSRTTATGFRPR